MYIGTSLLGCAQSNIVCEKYVKVMREIGSEEIRKYGQTMIRISTDF